MKNSLNAKNITISSFILSLVSFFTGYLAILVVRAETGPYNPNDIFKLISVTFNYISYYFALFTLVSLLVFILKQKEFTKWEIALITIMSIISAVYVVFVTILIFPECFNSCV